MESFEQYFEKYEYLIYGAMVYLKIYRDKDDFYQIGLGALYEAFLKFDSEKGEFDKYAYATILGRLRTNMTRTNRHTNHLISVEPHSITASQNFITYDSPLQWLIFETYLTHLTPHQARVITERYWCNNDVKTTALHLGISCGAVKNCTRDAFVTLRKHYKK